MTLTPRARLALVTSITGLSRADVRERRDRGEVNTLPNDTGRSLWRILQANLFTLFNAIVGGSFLVLLALGYWQDALFGFFVIANVAIGVAQEFRAKVTLSRLAVLNAPRARVLRRASDDHDGEVGERSLRVGEDPRDHQRDSAQLDERACRRDGQLAAVAEAADRHDHEGGGEQQCQRQRRAPRLHLDIHAAIVSACPPRGR